MYRVQGYRRFTPWLIRIGTPAFRHWIVSVFPDPNVRRAQEVIDIIWNKATEIFELKKALVEKGDQTLLDNMEESKDLISILRKSTFQDWKWAPA